MKENLGTTIVFPDGDWTTPEQGIKVPSEMSVGKIRKMSKNPRFDIVIQGSNKYCPEAFHFAYIQEPDEDDDTPYDDGKHLFLILPIIFAAGMYHYNFHWREVANYANSRLKEVLTSEMENIASLIGSQKTIISDGWLPPPGFDVVLCPQYGEDLEISIRIVKTIPKMNALQVGLLTRVYEALLDLLWPKCKDIMADTLKHLAQEEKRVKELPDRDCDLILLRENGDMNSVYRRMSRDFEISKVYDEISEYSGNRGGLLRCDGHELSFDTKKKNANETLKKLRFIFQSTAFTLDTSKNEEFESEKFIYDKRLDTFVNECLPKLAILLNKENISSKIGSACLEPSLNPDKLSLSFSERSVSLKVVCAYTQEEAPPTFRGLISLNISIQSVLDGLLADIVKITGLDQLS